jgi:subtilisin family serine protease
MRVQTGPGPRGVRGPAGHGSHACQRGRAGVLIASAALVFSAVLPAAAREPAPFVPNDSLYHLSRAGLESMSVPQAWRVTQGDPRVVVAVVDSGVDRNPDLTPNLLPGFNAIDGSSDTTDENGHGSEQAALIGAVLDNGLGAAGICGRCRVLPVKVFGADGRANVDTIARGIRWASEHGARVINLSFALEPGSRASTSLNDAVADALSRGISVVAGAGNNGSADPAANAFAAANPQAIRVASIGVESHRLDANSNRGSWVDVAASAELSARGSGSGESGGTSAAAAAVSAISGLLLSCNPALTPAHIKDILMRTSTRYDVDVRARGEVDAYRAVLSSGCSEPPASADEVKLTVVIRGAGTVSRQPNAATYDPGTVVTLQARPRPGWRFATWRGICTGKRQTCRFMVTSAASITAVFRR